MKWCLDEVFSTMHHHRHCLVSYFVFRNVVQRYHSLTQPGVTTPTSMKEGEGERTREKKRDIIDDQMFPASGWLSRLDFLFLTSRCLLSCFSFYAVCASVETRLADFRNEARQNCSCFLRLPGKQYFTMETRHTRVSPDLSNEIFYIL